MTRFVYLVRHGDIDMSGRYIGRSDVELSEKGHAQAEALQPVLSKLGKVQALSSPLCRARETARRALPESRIDVLDELREIDFGRWEELTFEQIRERDPLLVDRWAAWEPDFGFPGGEALADFAARLDHVAARLAEWPGHEPLVLFTHGGVIRGLICRLLGLFLRQHLLFRIDYASISRLDLYGTSAVLSLLNDTRHLA